MNDEPAFIRAMQANPADASLRLIFADWLEEQGDPRGELIRLMHTLTQSVEFPERGSLEERLRNLLTAGVNPVGPFFTNSLGMKFAWIPAGTYLMGSPVREQGRQKNETQHRVTLTKGFYLGVHLVTQSCWQAVMGHIMSVSRGDDLPVDHVSWHLGETFLRKLSDKEGQEYRLPTEAEWEFACRAGTTTPFYFGKTIFTDQANFDGPYREGEKSVSREKTTPVGSFPANGFGVFDTHGNVWEWCQDWFEGCPLGDAVDPQGPPQGDSRVVRGGSFGNQAMYVRSASRNWLQPASSSLYVGFRAARDFPPCSPTTISMASVLDHGLKPISGLSVPSQPQR